MPKVLKTPKPIEESVPTYTKLILKGIYIANNIKSPSEEVISGNVRLGDAVDVDENGDVITEYRASAPYVLLNENNVIVKEGHCELNGVELALAMTEYYMQASASVAGILAGAGTQQEKVAQIIALLQIDEVMKAIMYPVAAAQLGITEADFQ